jgi:hypothetical protein
VADRDYTVDFDTLWVVPAWIEHHCVIADGFLKGRPFKMYDWQLWVTLNHYRIKDGVEQNPDYLAGDPEARPILSAAFQHRRTQVIAPQKTGKGPWSATIVCGEAVGPVLFLDWAKAGDMYRCVDYGCGCGWTYAYDEGEAMGHPWPTPLIQLLATSEDQVENVYRHLRVMARGEHLRDLMQLREGFIRLPNDGIIEVVTSSALSRLGNPLNFNLQDETQLYTEQNKLIRVAETMRRGAAAMGGRTIETTNCYDPSEQSVAQRTRESQATDIFKFYEPPPPGLKYTVARDRAKIHAYNYAGSPHADLNGIEGESAELSEKDPGQAERFYGNRIVAGLGSWCETDSWDARARPQKLDGKRIQVVLGFDGSDVDDWTGIRAQTKDCYQFTPVTSGGPTIWNPADYGGQVPRLEVMAAIDELFHTYDVIRMYADPPYWESEIDALAERWTDKRVIRWETFRPKQMYDAAQRLLTDVHKTDSEFHHDGCPVTALHVGNARRAVRLQNRYVLSKPGDGRKIDMAVCSVICHEAWGDVTNAKLWRRKYRAYSA